MANSMHGAIHLFDRLPQVDVAQQPADAGSMVPARSEPLVGVIRNPHSYGNSGSSDSYAHIPGVVVASPCKRSELIEIIADFAARQVDYIVIDGGDGTVRDVLTCGAGIFGDSWPGLILLPSGKTNALAHDLGIARDWTLERALDAARQDKVIIRRPLVVAQRDDERAQVRGFIMGAGAYTSAISLGQDAHNIGAFNAAAVGVTAIWSALQAIFGGRNNPWRRGTRMLLRDPDDGTDLHHSGASPADERYFMFASTLERFPAGLRPFGDMQAPVRLALLDNSHRRLLLRLPAIFRGRVGDGTRRRGGHTFGLQAFDFDIADRFILDGEAFPSGSYRVSPGPRLRFIVP